MTEQPSTSGPTILLTGKTGQVGFELQKTLAALGEVVAPERDRLDLTRPESIREVVQDVRPDVVVNAAAYTAVDAAETDSDVAHAVNAVAPGVLADEAARLDAWMIHYSTDYVFDGTNTTPYTEDDPENPLGVYGQTKWEGERAVQAAGGRFLIFRTSGVYSARRSNFVRTMLRLADGDGPIRVVDDQVVAPTWAGWIARATKEVLHKGWSGDSLPSGRYHMCSRGQTTWYGFAESIFSVFRKDDVAVEPIPSSEYPTDAERPAYSVMSPRRVQNDLEIDVPTWTKQLDACARTWEDVSG